MFITNLVYLVKTYAPLDSQITVSSILSSDFNKEKVRFDYYGLHCAWIKSNSDSSPWINFDLLQSRSAIGVQIGDDDITWSYIGTDVQAVYEGMLCTWWFDRVVSSRYWRIEPVTYNLVAAMQADIIG